MLEAWTEAKGVLRQVRVVQPCRRLTSSDAAHASLTRVASLRTRVAVKRQWVRRRQQQRQLLHRRGGRPASSLVTSSEAGRRKNLGRKRSFGWTSGIDRIHRLYPPLDV